MKKVIKGISLKLMFNILNIYMNLITICSFCLKQRKLIKSKKLVADLRDEKEHIINVGNLKQALNHGLALKKNHKFIKFNQKD